MRRSYSPELQPLKLGICSQEEGIWWREGMASALGLYVSLSDEFLSRGLSWTMAEFLRPPLGPTAKSWTSLRMLYFLRCKYPDPTISQHLPMNLMQICRCYQMLLGGKKCSMDKYPLGVIGLNKAKQNSLLQVLSKPHSPVFCSQTLKMFTFPKFIWLKISLHRAP